MLEAFVSISMDFASGPFDIVVAQSVFGGNRITTRSKINNLTCINLVLSTPSATHSSEVSGTRDHVDDFLQVITMKNRVIDN